MAALAIGIALVFSICFTAIKAGLPYAPPLLFGGLRALIAGVFLLGLVKLSRQSLFPPRRIWVWMAPLALSATTLSFGAMFLSPGRTSAGIASVLGNTQPLVTIALASVLLSEPMTRGKSAALAFGLLGALLISIPALAGPDAYGIPGIALALTTSAGAAVGSVIVKSLGSQPVLSIAAWQLTMGSLPLLAISTVVERDVPVMWRGEFVFLLLFLALIGTAATTAIWYWLIQREDIGRLTLFLFLVPVFGLGIASFAFNERISLAEGTGAALIVAGVGAAGWESWMWLNGLSRARQVMRVKTRAWVKWMKRCAHSFSKAN